MFVLILVALLLNACTEPSGTASSDVVSAHPGAATTLSTSDTRDEVDTVMVLAYHKTEGFEHDSISAGVEALGAIGRDFAFSVTATTEARVFTEARLDPFDVVVFLNTTGDVLDAGQQEAIEAFIQSGGGFVGVHSAADTEYDWAWYGELLGTYFADHPEPQQATVLIPGPGSHPVTAGLPGRFELFDEWYNFRGMPTPATVLATVDETTYEGGTMGSEHPIAWGREFDGGRAVYLGFGHTREAFANNVVRALLANAIEWASARLD